MIKDLFDFPFPGKNIVCEQEEQFKTVAERQFGLKVKQTLFEKGGKGQYHLYVWYESTVDDPFADESKWENDQVVQQNIIKSYFACYNMLGECYPETYLHPRDYRKALISYSYGHAEVSVKKAIQQQYKGTLVSLDYASETFIIESDLPLTNKENDILHICYQFLKEHDHYNVITLRDARIKIITGNSDFNLNDIHMTNRRV